MSTGEPLSAVGPPESRSLRYVHRRVALCDRATGEPLSTVWPPGAALYCMATGELARLCLESAHKHKATTYYLTVRLIHIMLISSSALILCTYHAKVAFIQRQLLFEDEVFKFDSSMSSHPRVVSAPRLAYLATWCVYSNETVSQK